MTGHVEETFTLSADQIVFLMTSTHASGHLSALVGAGVPVDPAMWLSKQVLTAVREDPAVREMFLDVVRAVEAGVEPETQVLSVDLFPETGGTSRG